MLENIKKAFFVTTIIVFVIAAYKFSDAFFEKQELNKLEVKPNEFSKEKITTVEKSELKKIPLKDSIAILVLGADSLIPGKLKGWFGRSDFIALVYINPFQQKVHILSIPRDTKVSLKKHEISRINAANQLGGYKFAKRAVQRLLGIKIKHVFVFSIQAVIDMIDTLGPIKIFVPQAMNYDDNSADLHINIKPGLQEMDGQQLMNFVRFRNKNKGDIGRIERQHIFFRSALRKLQEPEIVFRLPQFLFQANKAFISDMDFSEMFQLGLLARSLTISDVSSHIVPGDFGSDGSWLVNKAELQDMMDKITDEKSLQQ